MKRSEINQKILDAKSVLEGLQVKLPPFAYWTPAEWTTKGTEYDEIRECMLGWDVTDFGSGDFDACGLLLITTRNGIAGSKKHNKTYAQKYLFAKENQYTPFHFHWAKAEDIINVGGGDLIVQLFNADENEEFADTPIEVTMDGRVIRINAGDMVRVKKGESVTLLPYQYHKFWPVGGDTLLMEVSMVNDDHKDNRFHEARGRFPAIVEDESPIHLLVTDYDNYKK